jgi:hypothetical protein
LDKLRNLNKLVVSLFLLILCFSPFSVFSVLAAPSGSIIINEGSEYTSSKKANLLLNAIHAKTMILSETENFEDSEWICEQQWSET